MRCRLPADGPPGAAEISAVFEMRSLNEIFETRSLKTRNSTPQRGLDTLPPTSKAHPARSGDEKSHNSLFQKTLDVSPFDSKTGQKNPARSLIPEDRGGRGRVLTSKHHPETPVSPIFHGQSYQIYFRAYKFGIVETRIKVKGSGRGRPLHTSISTLTHFSESRISTTSASRWPRITASCFPSAE